MYKHYFESHTSDVFVEIVTEDSDDNTLVEMYEEHNHSHSLLIENFFVPGTHEDCALVIHSDKYEEMVAFADKVNAAVAELGARRTAHQVLSDNLRIAREDEERAARRAALVAKPCAHDNVQTEHHLGGDVEVCQECREAV